jgi:L-threonylcarbamoyladenylate synthase
VVANKQIDVLNQPSISTSANIRAGQPAAAVSTYWMMDGRVDLVLDGGMCAGTGSTTVDVTGSTGA